MMQSEQLQPSWPLFNMMDSSYSSLDQAGFYGQDMHSYICHDHQFSSSVTTPDDFSGISIDSYFPTMFSDEFVQLPIMDDEMQVTLPLENSAQDMEGFEVISGSAIEVMCKWLDESDGMGDFTSQQSMESEDVWSPGLSTRSSEASVIIPPDHPSLVLPGDDMEFDSQLSLCHLLKAYAEATEMGQRDLADVIVGCISEKVGPLGGTLERIAFNLFQHMGNEGAYLKQESSKNLESAFHVFYQSFPYGRFAHFAANTALLEAIPDDVTTVHIVDFDKGEGVQWPPVIEAIGRQKKALRLTFIKSEESDHGFAPSQWMFEGTQRRLYDHATSAGLSLKVEEMRLGDLVRQIEESRKKEGEREWLAFNCMTRLPHMGRTRIRRSVTEFLRAAKELLANSTTKKGLITFADGEGDIMTDCSRYSSFFEGRLRHYQALCESMESNFPMYLAEARIAMESLFVAPYVSSLSWLQKWEEIRESSSFQAGDALDGLRMSRESLLEAKEMVKEGETSYKVKIEGQNENEMVLEWRGTPLVRVSTWA
ncbi:hypothetical protein RJ640_009854 [Escallonia rubra]|uniref:Nodulation-signaling pathway 2 protein n=1 Tax=Escallonia rubra TaxID=112253 RepID=A0AA88QN72_9ASTE|nr:hypothetical protein RJ640_009854 [Escallonia rubra]